MIDLHNLLWFELCYYKHHNDKSNTSVVFRNASSFFRFSICSCLLLQTTRVCDLTSLYVYVTKCKKMNKKRGRKYLHATDSILTIALNGLVISFLFFPNRFWLESQSSGANQVEIKKNLLDCFKNSIVWYKRVGIGKKGNGWKEQNKTGLFIFPLFSPTAESGPGQNICELCN